MRSLFPTRIAPVTALAAAVLLATGGCGADRPPLTSEPPSSVRAQVWIYWGGGEPRSWAGRIALPGEPARSALVWLADFEPGDHAAAGTPLEIPVQRVPADLGNEFARRAEARPAAPASTVRIESTTEGEADGVVAEIVGPRGASVAIDLGGVAATLALDDLLAEPVVLPADDAGNVVLVGGRDLDRLAPLEAAHHGERAHLASLHTHSIFSTNTHGMEAVTESLLPWVRRIWWTDHQPETPRRVAGGSFDRHEDLGYWTGTGRPSASSRVFRVRDAYAGDRALAVRMIGARGEIIEIRHLGGSGLLGVPIALSPRLRWAWKVPPPESGVAFVDVWLASGRRLRYASAPLPPPPEAGAEPVDEHLVEAVPGRWQTVERDLAADLGTAGREEAIHQLSLGVVLVGERTLGLFDEIELDVPSPRELEALRRHRLAATGDLVSHLGAEQSFLVEPDSVRRLEPHLTILSEAAVDLLFELPGAVSSVAERQDLFAAVHARGGVIGTHHLQDDISYARFLDDRGRGVDLFEIAATWLYQQHYSSAAEQRDRDSHGYPGLYEDEVYPLLVRWDRTTARGLLLTGYGAPDLNGRFDRPTDGFFNRWLSWIHAADDDDRSLTEALRAGRVSGVEWRSGARLDLTAGGASTMGKLMVTDQPTLDVRARYSGAVAGSRLRWIVGRLAAPDAVDVPPAEAVRSDLLSRQAGERTLTVEVGRGVFVRVELLEPTGHLVAFSNPIHLTPFAPDEWPRGRIAFDWAGLRLVEEHGLALEDADLSGGRLSLVGEAFAPTARLRLEMPPGALAWLGTAPQGATLRTRLGADGVVLDCPASGPFSLAVELADSRAEWPHEPLERLPERKPLYFELDVGDKRPDLSTLLVEGFGPPRGRFLDPWWRVGAGGARFRLAVPPGEPAWLKITTAHGNRASGQILAAGRPLGHFQPYDELVFALPDELTAAADTEGFIDFELRLDPGAGDSSEPVLLVRRLQILHGDGVIDY